jgi:bifunctional DNA-binding transcriptional regulator/antitoxin component of YhaV-PrlF toxin-antitoxin module
VNRGERGTFITSEEHMSRTKLSATYNIRIPREVRESAHLKRGQAFQIVVKGGIIHLVPEHSLEELRGFARGISMDGLRDKSDRE